MYRLPGLFSSEVLTSLTVENRKILQDEGPLSDTPVSATDAGSLPGRYIEIRSSVRFEAC
jgi:hypothetical protein